MIHFQKTDKQLVEKHKQRLKQLYMEAFTKGISAQHITSKEADVYLYTMFTNGYGILGFSEDDLVAVLISIPPSLDKERPIEIQNTYADTNTEYIAEVLVDENYRGMGLGKKLMQEFENFKNKSTKHILLRVWDQNEAAVNLYLKSGFHACGNISQIKYKPNTKEPFTMHKIYMLKTF